MENKEENKKERKVGFGKRLRGTNVFVRTSKKIRTHRRVF